MKALILLALVSGFGTLNDDDWPPQRFRAVGTTQVTFVRSQQDIDRMCGKASRGFVTEACAYDSLVVLPDPCGFSGDLARLECHELAHRFGNWSGRHPR